MCKSAYIVSYKTVYIYVSISVHWFVIRRDSHTLAHYTGMLSDPDMSYCAWIVCKQELAHKSMMGRGMRVLCGEVATATTFPKCHRQH